MNMCGPQRENEVTIGRDGNQGRPICNEWDPDGGNSLRGRPMCGSLGNQTSQCFVLKCEGLPLVGAFLRKTAAHQITASDFHTFTNTFLINMRMMFVMTTT